MPPPDVRPTTIYVGLVKVLQDRLEARRCNRRAEHAIRGPHDIFYGIKAMTYGDDLRLQAFGPIYVYEIRESLLVWRLGRSR